MRHYLRSFLIHATFLFVCCLVLLVTKSCGDDNNSSGSSVSGNVSLVNTNTKEDKFYLKNSDNSVEDGNISRICNLKGINTSQPCVTILRKLHNIAANEFKSIATLMSFSRDRDSG